MAKGAAAGSSFLAGVLAKLPEADRAKGQEALQTLQALGGGAVIAAIGDGTLAQEELSRQLDALKKQQEDLDTLKTELTERDQQLTSYHADLTKWYDGNKAALEEYKTMKAGGGGGGRKPTGAGDGKDLPGGITPEALDERIRAEQAGFLGFSRDQNKITREHFAKFGEVLDLEPLLLHPEVGKIGLVGVYTLVHKDRLAKHEADAQKAAEDKIRADERAKVLAEQAQFPYPTPTGVGSGSPLDALSGDKKPDSLVDAATQHYQRLTQQRASGVQNPT
jgi:hypothetical protein